MGPQWKVTKNYIECEVGQGACGCKSIHWRQGWRAVEAGRETVEADYVIYNRSNTCSDNNSNADYKLMEY